ncbi:unnamed protein product, partial [Allacma fusca]
MLKNLDTDELSHVTSMLLALCLEDIQFYRKFQQDGIEQCFERQIMKSLVSDHAQAYDKFSRYNCWYQVSALITHSQQNAKWMTALQVLGDLQKWKNQSKEEIQDRFSVQVFNVWGVDWFIESIKFRDDEQRNNWCEYHLAQYLDKLLRIWRIQGNIETFMKSQVFVNAFMDIGKIRLQDIRFFWKNEVSEYFRLSSAAIHLLDDKKIRDEFTLSLVPLFENALKQLIKDVESTDWNIHEILIEFETESRVKEFKRKVET